MEKVTSRKPRALDMAVWQAILYHKLQYFFLSQERWLEKIIICVQLVKESFFWKKIWRDDTLMLEFMLKFNCVKRNNRGIDEFVYSRSISSLRSLIQSTAIRFELALFLPAEPIATYPRYYLWYRRGNRIVHSHSVLHKILNRIRGWQVELPMEEKGIKCYTYTHPDTAKVTSFGFAWPDLLDTPVLHLLRFARFVTEPGKIFLCGMSEVTFGPQMKMFSLREYIPLEIDQYVSDDWACLALKRLKLTEYHRWYK